MIYNGKPLNARCRTPPNVQFPPMHDMLRRLTRPGVARFACYDYSTWFIQLRLSAEVRDVFVVQTRDGKYWRVSGLPMGWAWAPVVAQRAAETIVREALRRMEDGGVGAFTYIDNVIFYVDDSEDVDRRLAAVDVIFREVCREAGAVIKESATVLGTAADWLGVIVTAGQRRVTLRRGFVERVQDVQRVVWEGSEMPVRFWWKAVGMCIRALWVARKPLALVRDVMRWLVRMAVRLDSGRVSWECRVKLWSEAARQISRVFEWIVKEGGAFAVWEPAMDGVVVYGVSDAAGGCDGTRGYLWRWGKRVVVARLAAREEKDRCHINEEEWDALEEGLMAVMEEMSSGLIRWMGDNTVANAWARGSWAPEAGRNARLLKRWRWMEEKRVDVIIEKVGGGADNPADVLTRARGCTWLAAGACWSRELLAKCECIGICEHVRELVKDFVESG